MNKGFKLLDVFLSSLSSIISSVKELILTALIIVSIVLYYLKRKSPIKISKSWHYGSLILVEVVNYSKNDLGTCKVNLKLSYKSNNKRKELIICDVPWATTQKPYEEISFPKPEGLKDSVNHFIIPLCNAKEELASMLSYWIKDEMSREDLANEILNKYTKIFADIPEGNRVDIYAQIRVMKKSNEGAFGPLYKSKWIKLFTVVCQRDWIEIVKYNVNVEYEF